MVEQEQQNAIQSNQAESHKEHAYLGAIQSELDHYYGNHIGLILMLLDLKNEKPDSVVPERFQKPLSMFINGLHLILERIQDGSIKESQEINSKIIREFVELAEQVDDPSDLEQINPIIEKYNQLKY